MRGTIGLGHPTNVSSREWTRLRRGPDSHRSLTRLTGSETRWTCQMAYTFRERMFAYSGDNLECRRLIYETGSERNTCRGRDPTHQGLQPLLPGSMQQETTWMLLLRLGGMCQQRFDIPGAVPLACLNPLTVATIQGGLEGGDSPTNAKNHHSNATAKRTRRASITRCLPLYILIRNITNTCLNGFI
jgi:hypothetical protein